MAGRHPCQGCPRLDCAGRLSLGHHDKGQRNVLVYGAGDLGVLAYQFLTADKTRNVDVKGFLDDDITKRYKTLYGRKILGNRYTLGAVVELYNIQEVVLALSQARSQDITAIKQACQQAGVHCWTFPLLVDTAPVRNGSVSEAALADLIETPNIQLDVEAVNTLLQGKIVLVVGPGGEFGVELCRQILCFRPDKLIVIDRYEAYLTELMLRLADVADDRIVPVCVASLDNGKVAEVVRQHSPYIVVHAATRKYPSLVDIQVEDIVRMNYLSTFALARQAADNHCAYFVLVSSDEAARRGSPIADTLRSAEIILQQFFAEQSTRLVTIRLNNILENRGGLVAVLKEQIAQRESVTLLHPDSSGHFLSKRTAVHFLLQSLVLAYACPADEGIFVCNQGRPVSLFDVANKLASYYGVQLESDLPVTFLQDVLPEEATVCDSDHTQRMPTAHAHITRLQDSSLSARPDVASAVRHLFNLQEDDLEHAAWEKSTYTLLAAPG